MGLVNTASGYGSITKTLHWLTVALVIGQFVLGYGMEAFAEALFEEEDGGGDRQRAGDDQLVFAHAWLGLAILAVTVVRATWRSATRLPDWSERLGAGARRLEHVAETVLYVTLFVIPLSGAALLYASGEERELADRREWYPPFEIVGDDLMLVVHVAGHLTFFAALALHIAIGVRHRTLARML